MTKRFLSAILAMAAVLLLLGLWAMRVPSSEEVATPPTAVASAQPSQSLLQAEDVWNLGWETAEQELDDLEIALVVLDMDKALSGQQSSVESLSYDMLSLEFGLNEF